MEKIKINLPDSFDFETEIPVLIEHMNHGNHLGNESYISITNEARVRFFKLLGIDDFDIGDNISILISTIVVNFLQQVYHGEILKVKVALTGYKSSEFEMIYQMSKGKDNLEVARVLVRLLCFDKENDKVVNVPESFIKKINDFKI